ncbi:hypothetical protein P0082_02370 [Candidatus Haliotispira prima]|uniref:Uncharacterized protein n=1 Tax=Candidatus Haliotispira prima TaxID=3034016 RepID=A0ABY8MKK5_9SPIO|nr:hypothetical protein P0082_02370 [Candidatus Haliotispira prima]
MASSLQLEMSSNVEITNIGAVIRLDTEAAPTEAEAQASPGYVSISIPAGVTRKISISQHYGSIFSDGLTLDDVLAANTAYKLHLYFPASRIPATAELTGLSIANDKAVVSFTTAVLPAEGDAKWLNSNGSKCVASLDTLYFMQAQTGVVVCYFYTNFSPLTADALVQNKEGVFNNFGAYDGTTGVPSNSGFHYVYEPISGYTSNSTNHYRYWIGGDNGSILENSIRSMIFDGSGNETKFDIPVTRH